MKTLLLILGLLSVSALTATAGGGGETPATVDFSLTGDGTTETVSGQLEGYVDIYVDSFYPISAVITSAPASFGLNVPLSLESTDGEFEVSNGLLIDGGASFMSTSDDTSLALNEGGDYLALPSGQVALSSSGGFSAINFTAVDVPEPGSLALILSGGIAWAILLLRPRPIT